jgi:hypothetical protein
MSMQRFSKCMVRGKSINTRSAKQDHLPSSPIRTIPSALELPQVHRWITTGRGLYRRSGIGNADAFPHPAPKTYQYEIVLFSNIENSVKVRSLSTHWYGLFCLSLTQWERHGKFARK